MNAEIIVSNYEEIEQVAALVFTHLTTFPKGESVMIKLNGDLGAGKTTLVQHIGKLFGVKKDIVSPTFVLMKEYVVDQVDFFSKLFHIDAYRIEDDKEAQILRVREMMKESGNVVFVEWPENIDIGEHQNTIDIYIHHLGEGKRKVIIK